MESPMDIDLARIPKLEKETNDILKTIRESCQNFNDKKIQEEVQEEIAKIVVLLQRIEKVILRNCPRKIWWEKIPNIITPDKRRIIQEESKILINFLDIAVASLLQKEPNLYFSRNIRIDVERVLYRYEHPAFGSFINRFMDTQRSESTPLKVISGLIFALIVYGTVASTITCSLLIYSLYSVTQVADRSSTAREIEKLTEKLDLTASRLIKLGSNPSSPSVPNGSVNSEINNLEIAKETTKFKKLQNDLSFAQKRLDDFKARFESNIKNLIEVLLVISAGTLGSIVSILIRIEDFQDKKYVDRLVPFLVGAFKPIIGASFAAFFFALISSEIVTIPSLSKDTQKDKRVAFIFAVAFVVGFSERIAKDTIGRAEDMIGGKQEAGVVKETEELHSTKEVRANSLPEGNSQVIFTEDKKNTIVTAVNRFQGSVETTQNNDVVD